MTPTDGKHGEMGDSRQHQEHSVPSKGQAINSSPIVLESQESLPGREGAGEVNARLQILSNTKLTECVSPRTFMKLHPSDTHSCVLLTPAKSVHTWGQEELFLLRASHKTSVNWILFSSL